jgi:membrane associated rhomboid family serine protease
MFPYRDNIPLARTPIVTYLLIAVNVAVLVGMSRLPENTRDDAVYRYGFVPARIGQLAHGRPLEVAVPVVVQIPLIGPVPGQRALELPADRAEIIASCFTSLFMHGNLLHLLSNMWFLWLFGDNVEDRLGRATFVVFYLLGGLAATACQWAHDPSATVPMVGASGAVAAVLGGYAITWPHARVRSLIILFIFITTVELPALLFLGGWFLLQLLEASRPDEFGVAGGVAWWAHIGGFLAGLVMMPLLSGLRPEAHPKERFGFEEF